MDTSSLTTDPGRVRSLRYLEWTVGIYAVILITTSIVMFMMNNTSESVSTLIAKQNDAALKLWVNLDYYQHHHAKDGSADASLPPGLFESVVEFSRTNVTIIKLVHRLSPRTIFSPRSSLDEISNYIKPTDGRQPALGQKVYFDHFGVDPHVDTSNVTEQGMYQIELYQAIRDYAQDESAFYKGCLGALSVYLMPVFYALLGASLRAFRSASFPLGRNREDMSAERSSRFVVAAIAGIAISSLSTLLTSDVVLSPLAIAFVFGYSIEIFTSRLDVYIAGLTKSDATGGIGRTAQP